MDFTQSHDHDHGRCIADALAAAERLCEARAARLTDLRRRVLELVLASHQPAGAYDLLERLGEGRRKVAPQTVYRALDFLIEQRLIHRIASLNAFIGCTHPEHHHAAQFLICSACREVTELGEPGIEGQLSDLAAARGFDVASVNIEITGLCARCRPADQSDQADLAQQSA